MTKQLARLLIPFAFCSTLGGCSLYQPYITVDEDYGPCRTYLQKGALNRESALAQACAVQAKLRAKRRDQVVSQNITASILVPSASVVGYRTARNLSGASTTAIATGGLGIYALSQHLIQPSRYLIYDRGEQAIGCAIGLHQQEASAMRTSAPSLNRLLAAKGVFDSEFSALTSADQKKFGPQRVRAINIEAEVRGLVQGALDGNLARATQRIVSEVNTAITSTNLPLTALAPQIDPLFKVDPKATAVPLAANSIDEVFPGHPGLEAAWDLLLEAYAELMANPKQAMSGVDFNTCSVGPVQVSPTVPEQPFALGPGNIDYGSIKELKDAPLVVQLVGGRAPFDAKLAGASDDQLKLEIKAVGASSTLTVVRSDTTAADTQYLVLVSDAAGAMRSFSVKTQPATKK